MKYLALLIFSLIYPSVFSQNKEFVKTDGITHSLHQKNIGKVTFMSENIPLDQYKETDFLTSFDLENESNLNIRVFMDNSVTNYLQQLAPNLTSEEVVKKGNLQFAFYIDNKLIYKEHIHHGCNFGSKQSKNTATTFRVPLTSTKGEDWWAMYMWDRFNINGGEKALTDGTHNLKIEIRPYVYDMDEYKIGNLIAEGEIILNITTPIITAEQIAIQQIQPTNDWTISNIPFDREKIEMLNEKIVSYNFKGITSIVVIREGKLMLEEYFNEANRNTLHDTRSAGKSFTSTMMGIAINDRYISDENQTLNTFYDLKEYANYDKRKDSITIKDLLTMSSVFNGSDAASDSPGNEENMYPTDNWVKFTLDLSTDNTKKSGGQWDYFTAGVVLLGDIINKSVSGGMEEYTHKNLFQPLNISQYKWQYTPQKVVNTAGSLQMKSLDYAKYAQLYKNNGIWNGKQIIPSSWIAKTLTQQIQIKERDNEYYGYLFWNKTFNSVDEKHEAFYCAGNGGNVFVIFKDLPITIIITSKAYNKPYAHSQTNTIICDYILPAILK